MTSQQQQALLAALRFYADRKLWHKDWREVDGRPGQAWEATCLAWEDAGKLARDALKEMG